MKKTYENWRKIFFIIFTGQVFSLIGSAVVQFSIIWWLTAKTGSAVVLTVASLVGFLPAALLGPFIGTLIDRHNRKTIMIGADMTVAAASLILAGFFVTGEPPVGIVYGVLALRAIGSAFHMPSLQASIPLIAPPEDLTRVAGWNQLLFSAANIAGPMLGAFMLGIMSMEFVLMVDVAGAVLASTALLMVHIPQPEPVEGEASAHGFLEEMKYGIRQLTESRLLLVMTIAITLTAVLYIPVGALFNLMVVEHFKGGPWHAGIVEIAFGIGMLAGSALLGYWGVNMKKSSWIVMAMFILGVGLTVSGMLPVDGFIGFVFCSAVMGLSGPLFNGAYITLIQMTIEPAALGRVMSLTNSMMLLVTPVGLFIAGPAAEALGVARWFMVSGVLILAVGLGTLFVPAVRRGTEKK